MGSTNASMSSNEEVKEWPVEEIVQAKRHDWGDSDDKLSGQSFEVSPSSTLRIKLRNSIPTGSPTKLHNQESQKAHPITSSAPTQGRQAKVQSRCYNCDGTGHFARSCPDVECWRCFQKGHIKANCTNAKVCKHCRKGHDMSKACMLEDVTCIWCAAKGIHHAVNCPYKILYQQCYRCKKKGHVARKCQVQDPQDWCGLCNTNRHCYDDCSKPGPGQIVVVPSPVVRTCYACKGIGHFISDCANVCGTCFESHEGKCNKRQHCRLCLNVACTPKCIQARQQKLDFNAALRQEETNKISMD